MCGRYSLATPVEALRALFGFDALPNLAPRYNIAPTQLVPVVRLGAGDGRRELVRIRWGLIPSWARDAGTGSRMINARADTVADKPVFRTAFRRRRCLVPADGFYEWRVREDGRKEPWRITLEGGAPFAFAGLWEQWRAGPDEAVESFTIVTTDASAAIAAIYPRMPVILDRRDYGVWLSGPSEAAAALMRPYGGALTAYRVSARVNSVRNDDAGLIEQDFEADGPLGGQLRLL